MDINSYINYALRLWRFDESAAKELRDSEASSIWTNLGIVVLFSLVVSIISVIPALFMSSSSMPSGSWGVVGTIISSLVFVVVGLVFFVLFMLLSQLWINVFGGDRSLLKTIEVFVIIYLPAYVISTALLLMNSFVVILNNNILTATVSFIIVLVSLILFVYVTGIIMKIISITHKIDQVNAYFAGTLTLATLYLLLFIVIFMLFMVGGASMGGTGF